MPEIGMLAQGCRSYAGALPGIETQICRVVGQHNSTQRRYGKGVSIEEDKLRQRLWEIEADHTLWAVV